MSTDGHDHSDQKNSEESESPPLEKKDSFGVPVEKSPWLVYALLQIPIVIIMVVILYFAYQSFKEGQ